MMPRPGRARQILVISPAGRIYEHDKVQWYDHPAERIASQYFNTGDMVVYDSTLKLLDYERANGMEITHTSDGDIERYKSADYAIVRGSNFIHNRMVWDRAVEILEKTQLPVYALGVGGQAPNGGDYRLTGDNLRFWQIVSERSKLIGVRGRFTADLLSANGIRNVEIVGCPSLFRGRNRALTITAPAEIRRVAFSVRREVDRDYAASPGDYLRFQRDFLLKAAATFDTTITTHGEIEEKAFHFKNEPAMAEAREIFFREGWFTPETASRLEALYREQLVFFLRVEDYDAFIRTQDFAIGYRVHGVLPALANGVAGFLVRYDSRSAELADTFAIPSMVLGDGPPGDIAALLRSVSFEDFNTRYPLRYDQMRFVLEANGLAHRLQEAG